MNKLHPKLTVLMSVYNGMPYVKEAIYSILHQTFRDYIFLIIDDGSTDGTSDYLKTIKDKRVCIVHQKNAGLGAALNVGLNMIETKYAARMDADDIALPGRLGKQVKFMEEHSEVGMLGCRFVFTINGLKHDLSPPLPLMHAGILDVLSKGGHAISHPTVCFRTDLAKSVGGYRISGEGEDWDFFLRMSEITHLANFDEVLG